MTVDIPAGQLAKLKQIEQELKIVEQNHRILSAANLNILEAVAEAKGLNLQSTRRVYDTLTDEPEKSIGEIDSGKSGVTKDDLKDLDI